MTDGAGRGAAEDERVARNRTTPPRRTPGRVPLGQRQARWGAAVTVAVLAAASLTLLAVLLAPPTP